jgi:hypothetical protein
MNVVQNEFILLINAYYQADALSKNLIASGIFGNIQIQPELSQFREHLGQSSEMLVNMIKEAEQSGKKGEIDKAIMKAKLNEIYNIENNFLTEIESSISNIKVNNGDMTSYRISFQMASDTIYNFVGGTIQNLGPQIPLKDGVFNIIESILTENYWEGDDLIQQVNFIRSLKNNLNYSNNWIKEYAYRMFLK